MIHNGRRFDGGLGSDQHSPDVWVGVSNYPGVAGHRDAHNNTGDPPNPVNTGVFFSHSGIRMADITDGTSNTFAVGERETETCRSGAWVGIRNPWGSGGRGYELAVGHSRPKLNHPIIPGTLDWNTARFGCGEGFSSNHPGGAHFLLCDGSVRFVSETINHFWFGGNGAGTVAQSKNPQNGVYQRLMTRNDKLPVTLP